MADTEASREDRQLPASERRVQKAREDGRVARSRDLGHFAVLGAALAGAAAIGPTMARDTVAMVRSALVFEREAAMSAGRLPEILASLGADAIGAALPLVAGLCAVAIAATMIPGGVVLSTKPLDFELSRLSPSNGLKRVFSVRGAFDLARLLVLSLALGAIGSWFVATSLPEFAGLAARPLGPGLSGGAALMGAGLAALVGVLAAVALADVPFQWFRHRADLKMTHQEARQEAKESEGDPMLRGRMRARQREIAGRRMLVAVPAADVVITNPTHYAVAIRYDESAMNAPRVVAKGADLLAARIREIATQAGVPVLEAPPLARALYAHVEIDREIPAALYNAVAQVLAWVYQLRHRRDPHAASPAAPAAIEVPPGLDPAGADEAAAPGARR
ncbi:MAG: flagellar type III secretion system protein FlhB [Burkholderiales bacterium]|nr:flagellar type III secretion system protein FlhB [Burkholderiales bacterium]HMM51045.1 flagellar type III secretion system protein FlhB [Burkholderiaceae bacterium]